MVEVLTGSNRSAGTSYAEILDADSHPVHDILRVESPLEPGPTRVPAAYYYSREIHEREIGKIWKRLWQLACHEDEMREVGDYVVYDIAAAGGKPAHTPLRAGVEFTRVHPTQACYHRLYL